jgi:hydrogenase maturation protease
MIGRPGEGAPGGARRVLVIGCGSELRGDDGVGRRVADRIEALALPGVVVRSVVQLVPELALDVAAADLVILADADLDARAVQSERVTRGEAASPTAMSHHLTAASLLQLAATVSDHDASGVAVDAIELVRIPAHDLALGDRLSPRAESDVDAAVALVVEMIDATG